MGAGRRLIIRHPGLGAWVIVLAMMMRLLVPAGFMPVAEMGRVTIMPCSGYGPMTMPGGHRHRHDGKTDPAPCPFAAAAQPVTGGAPPVLALAAARFVLPPVVAAAAGQFAMLPDRLRPPLRAPPGASVPTPGA